jgi:hypothetical protein
MLALLEALAFGGTNRDRDSGDNRYSNSNSNNNINSNNNCVQSKSQQQLDHQLQQLNSQPPASWDTAALPPPASRSVQLRTLDLCNNHLGVAYSWSSSKVTQKHSNRIAALLWLEMAPLSGWMASQQE